MIITLDGPAGSGKSTAARLLADRLKFFHLDTGAIYRSVAYLCKVKNISLSDEEQVAEVASQMKIEFVKENNRQRVVVNGEDVSEKIRTPEISIGASDVGKLKQVRMALIDVQRRFAENNNIVAEGRDMGTVIFPNADIKFYLDASDVVRAKRRQLELKEKGIDEPFEKVLEDIRLRDIQDSKRDIAPLKPAEDAIVVNTDNMGIEDVLNFLFSEVHKKWK